MDAIDEPCAGNFRRYNALTNRGRSAAFSGGPVDRLHSGIAWVRRVCTHGSLERRDELLGGTVRVAWRKLRGYVDYERERAGSQKNWEWFQWLAEQIDRHSKARTSLTLGAHEAYRDWRP